MIPSFVKGQIFLRSLPACSIAATNLDENRIRHDLHFIDRGDHLKRRKWIYEQLHPETMAKVAGAIASNKAQGKGDANEIISLASFSEDTAAKTGMSSRTIQQEVQMSKSFTPEMKAQGKKLIIEKSLSA